MNSSGLILDVILDLAGGNRAVPSMLLECVGVVGVSPGCLASVVGRTGCHCSEFGTTSPGEVDLQGGSVKAKYGL